MFRWRKGTRQATDLLERWNAPFRDEAGAVAYVQREIEQAVPGGWTCRKIDDGGLCWEIRKHDLEPGEWMNQDYALYLSRDLQFLVITFGNNDVGAMMEIDCLMQAKFISTASLSAHPLSGLIRRVLSDCKPNEWGYT